MGGMKPIPPVNPARPSRSLLTHSGGAVVVETAIILPVLLVFLMGVLSMGTWFMAAHGVQQAANEGARAAIGGLDAADRLALAREGVASAHATAGAINRNEVTTTATQDGQYYTVTVTYAPAHPMWNSLGPSLSPPSQIRRRTTIRLNAS